MNLEQFLSQHYDEVVNSLDAVSRLRQFIMDLAVRGRLLAHEVKEEISIDHQNLHHPNKKRMPLDWTVSTVGELLCFKYGKSKLTRNLSKEGRVPVFGSNGVVGYCEEALCEDSTIIVGRKGSAGSVQICHGPSWTSDVSYYIEIPDYFLIGYLYIALLTLNLPTYAKGVKPGLSRSDVYAIPLNLPPMSDQSRIVAKVDKLLEQCNQLEEQFRERDTHLDQFTKASFVSLAVSGSNSTKFRNQVDIFIGNFDRLSVDTSQMKRLRRLIIDLAVQGKLVEQQEEDESTDDVVNEIIKERNKRIEKGEIKTKKVSKSVIECPPFVIPGNWLWVPLYETGFIRSGNSTNQTMKDQLTRNKTGYPYIMTKDVGYGFDSLNYENGMKVSSEQFSFQVTRPLSVVICAEGGSAGRKMGITDREICFGNKLIANETWSSISPYFLLCVYMSSYFYNELSTRMSGVISGISISKFLQLPFPLPPLAEQLRIVDKVSLLLGRCSLLEDQLSAAEVSRTRSLESLLAELLDT